MFNYIIIKLGCEIMNLKTKKRIMLSILALSLGTTGWGTNYQENALNEINDTLDDDFYNE